MKVLSRIKHHPVAFFVINFLVFLGLLFSQELKQISISGLFLASVIIFSIYTFYYFNSSTKKTTKKIFIKVLLVILAITLIHIVLNIINVYELVKDPQIQNHCVANQSSCNVIRSLFTNLKVYRFITLSHSFFSWLIIFLSFQVLFTTKIINQLIPSQQKIQITQVAVSLFIYLVITAQLASLLGSIFGITTRYFQLASVPYQQRFVQRMGGNHHLGWIYTYTQFINKHTPKNAVLFIPPKKWSWEMEGNAGYIRWFIYPRDTRSAQDLEDPIHPDAEYVLITDGIWWSEVHGWPRITIPANEIEKIWLIDRKTQVITESQSIDYEYQPGSDQWGLIKLRK